MKRTVTFVSVIVILAMLLTSCAAPTPQVIEKEKIVEKVVTQVVEKKVVETQVVEKTVEKQVEGSGHRDARTDTQQPQAINGWPTNDENEAKTAQAAWDAADKGQPDPAWKGQKFTIGVYSAGQRGAISGPTYFFRQKFEELTGATYDIVEIPFAEMREKIFTDFQTGAHNYDMILNCSNFYGDYIANDFVQPLDKYFEDPRMPEVGSRVAAAVDRQPDAMERQMVRHQLRSRCPDPRTGARTSSTIRSGKRSSRRKWATTCPWPWTPGKTSSRSLSSSTARTGTAMAIRMTASRST